MCTLIVDGKPVQIAHSSEMVTPFLVSVKTEGDHFAKENKIDEGKEISISHYSAQREAICLPAQEGSRRKSTNRHRGSSYRNCGRKPFYKNHRQTQFKAMIQQTA